ncbi:MAG: hypothetical protein ACRC8S_04165 [Fimbriiglobus sp.]
MFRKLFSAAAVLGLVASAVIAAEIKSGPQVDESLPGPFSPLNINGDSAGKKACLYCANGNNPVVMIFARNPNDEVTQKLIKKVDEAVVKNEKSEMGSFVVFCTDESDAEANLKKMAEKAELKKVVLSLDGPAGPAKYKFAKDADLTVIFYTSRNVKANHTFKKGELKADKIDEVLKDISKIVK